MNGIVYQPRELSDHFAMLGGYQLIHVWYQTKKILQIFSNKFSVWSCNGSFTFKTTKLLKGKVNFWTPCIFINSKKGDACIL